MRRCFHYDLIELLRLCSRNLILIIGIAGWGRNFKTSSRVILALIAHPVMPISIKSLSNHQPTTQYNIYTIIDDGINALTFTQKKKILRKYCTLSERHIETLPIRKGIIFFMNALSEDSVT